MHSGSYSIRLIKEVIQAEGTIAADVHINTLLTDSRRTINPGTALFFALHSRQDGHLFVPELYAAGVRCFVVKHLPEIQVPDASFLMVPDALAALQQLAAYHRRQFQLPVIGITGSNGKTIVKEWLHQLLSADYQIVRSPKSYNSQIGVPLSVWQMGKEDTLAIFEAGISTVKEMQRLEPIIEPTIGVLTHMGAAHAEGFNSDDEKLIEKLQLFKRCRLIIYQAEVLAAHASAVTAAQHFTWSRKEVNADLYINRQWQEGNQVHLQAIYHQSEIACIIPYHDEASIENAITCWAVLLALGYAPDEVAKRLLYLQPVRMRLELKNGRNNCSVIDDSYNSDLQSLEIALNFLHQQNQHPVKTLILSDILQSGLPNDLLYQQVAHLLTSKPVQRFIGVGEQLCAHQQFFKAAENHFYPDTAALIDDLQKLNFQHESILLKGARVFGFERISRQLVQKAHGTVLEINLNAIIHNLNYYRSQLKPGVKLMAMVKALSYGSGTFEVANVLQYQKADYLAVAYIDEGVALRQAGITLPIMVLNPEPTAFAQLIANQLEPEIYSLSLLKELLSYLPSAQEPYPIHIKIDTGMHRLGFILNELDMLCDMLKQHPEVRVQSVFSHLVASDAEVHDDFTRQQFGWFAQACSQLQQALGYVFIRHILNTSGITRWPEAQLDMVRLGIGLYGVDAAMPKGSGKLQPVASLKTSVSQIKNISAEETVGYNRRGILHHDGRIATVRIGYADGYLRAFGNGVGHLLVNGKPARTIGNIAMDMCMIDVTGTEVQEGDAVVVFNEQQPVEELAQQIGTIPYEILTNISQRVKRVYFYE